MFYLRRNTGLGVVTYPAVQAAESAYFGPPAPQQPTSFSTWLLIGAGAIALGGAWYYFKKVK
ncbi:unnamed protein product [marine sediment metagenome]|uniref:Uncharacterized protein n=1 Tax=marine sediment metagenome TaxID=412755 RepID=X0TG80_9ZZZZ